METQFAETTERVQDAIKQTSELFTKTTASLMDAYNKQLSTGYEFYKKLTETAQHDGKTKWADMIKESTASYEKTINSTMNLSKEIMEKTFSVFTKQELAPLSKENADAILNIFTKQAEQSRDFGTQFLHSLKIEDVFSSETFKKQSARFNELMQGSIQRSESAIKELIMSYNEQSVYTQEATKKLMNHIQMQTDLLAKTQAKFTEELMQTLKAKTSAVQTKDKGLSVSEKHKQPIISTKQKVKMAHKQTIVPTRQAGKKTNKQTIVPAKQEGKKTNKKTK